MEPSHKREMSLLLILMLVFAAFFIVALLNLGRGLPVFGMGISYAIEDYVIMILSLLSVLRILWAIIKH